MRPGSRRHAERMKTLAREQCKAELVRRLRTVRPDSARRWGRMSAHQMICHLSDAFRMAIGQKPVSDATGRLQRTLVKWIALYLPVRWPPGIPTRPEIDQQVGGNEAGRLCRGRRRARGAPGARGDAAEGVRLAGASNLRQDVARRLAPLGVPARGPSPASVRRLRNPQTAARGAETIIRRRRLAIQPASLRIRRQPETGAFRMRACVAFDRGRGRVRGPRAEWIGRAGALAAVERSGAERRGARRCAARVERLQERQLEGRDSGPWFFEPDRLGRHAVSHDGGANRQGRRRTRRRRRPRSRRQRGRGGTSLRRDGDRSPLGEDALAADRGDRDPARGIPPDLRQLRLAQSRDGRPARVCLLRLAGSLRVRHEREADLEARLQPADEDAPPVRRGGRGRAPRGQADHGVRSPGAGPARRDRRGDRQGAVERPAQ